LYSAEKRNPTGPLPPRGRKGAPAASPPRARSKCLHNTSRAPHCPRRARAASRAKKPAATGVAKTAVAAADWERQSQLEGTAAATASRVMASMRGQSLAATASLGIIHEPPHASTDGRAR